MKINKNLLVGLGIGLLAYYLYTRNKKKVQQPAAEQSKVGGSIPSIVNSIKPTNNNVVSTRLNKKPSTKPSQNQMFSDKRDINQLTGNLFSQKPLGGFQKIYLK
jgi:hypothetical protein